MRKPLGVLPASLLTICLLVFGGQPLRADPVSDFYAGKQIQFIVRTTPGGDYDLLSRVSVWPTIHGQIHSRSSLVHREQHAWRGRHYCRQLYGRGRSP